MVSRPTTELSKPSKVAYIFIDEGGDLTFSEKGSKYFTLTSVRTFRPFTIDSPLLELRFDMIEGGLDIEYFHASEDRQQVRDRVFALARKHLSSFRIDSIIVEKRKTGPSFRDDCRFYPEMLGYLIRFVVNGHDLSELSEIVVITDTIPVSRKRRAVEKAVKQVLSSMLLPSGVKYRVLHHASKSSPCLQIADYVNWAILRKWERGDKRSYVYIAGQIESEFDIFRRGSRLYY